MDILVIDVGGTNIKLYHSSGAEWRRVPSGPTLTPTEMVAAVREATADWPHDVISIGYPGVIKEGRIVKEPANLGPGWAGFDFAAAFNKPVRLLNDAAMQALGSYHGGRMLFLGLGTGLGNATVEDGRVTPLECGHLPYRKKQTFEQYIGAAGMERLGDELWEKHVHRIVRYLKDALVADYVVIGGGNSKRLKELPADSELGNNSHAAEGGIALWRDVGAPAPHVAPQ
jgi:polyphosphate glucokinase